MSLELTQFIPSQQTDSYFNVIIKKEKVVPGMAFLCQHASQLTTVLIRVQLMTIPQDAFIAGYAARYRVCIRGTSALDFPGHCSTLMLSNFWVDLLKHPKSATF